MAIEGTAGQYGTTLTTSSTAHTKGSWAEVIASTDENIALLGINVVSGDFIEFLIDIGTGSAGSETALISNIPWAGPFPITNSGLWNFLIPVNIPVGTRISARAQCDSGGATHNIKINVLAIGGASNTASVVTYGTSTATSSATTVDCGAVINTKGAYAEITASTTTDSEWIAIVFTGLADTDRPTNSFFVDIATGAAASETIIIENIVVSCDETMDGPIHAAYYFPLSIASGTRLSARAQTSTADATDRLIGVAIITSTKVASDFGTFGTGTATELNWFPEQKHIRPAPIVRPTGGMGIIDTLIQPPAPDVTHQVPQIPKRPLARDPKPEPTFYDNPTPRAPTQVTQTGLESSQAPQQAGVTQAGLLSTQQPAAVAITQTGLLVAQQTTTTNVNVTQIGLMILFVPGPGLPPPPVPPTPEEACPLDDFPIGDGSNRVCTD